MVCCTAKAKKAKPRERQLHQGHAGHFVDYVDAPDAKTAEAIAAKEHRIPDTLRDRLVAIREDRWDGCGSGYRHTVLQSLGYWSHRKTA
jgi:hypothetical protein